MPNNKIILNQKHCVWDVAYKSVFNLLPLLSVCCQMLVCLSSDLGSKQTWDQRKHQHKPFPGHRRHAVWLLPELAISSSSPGSSA